MSFNMSFKVIKNLRRNYNESFRVLERKGSLALNSGFCVIWTSNFLLLEFTLFINENGTSFVFFSHICAENIK